MRSATRRGRLLRRRLPFVLLALIAASVMVVPAAASEEHGQGADDVIPAEPAPDFAFGFSLLGAGDPLDLIPYPEEVRRYTLGTDVFEVWECADAGPVPISAADFVTEAEAKMTDYFGWLSGGLYDPDFIVGGVADPANCAAHARANATGAANGALFIRAGSGGLAGPGYHCAYGGTCSNDYPDNRREGYIRFSSESWTTVAHEMGHMLFWPHSYTRKSGSQYDNAIDLMSGNYNRWISGGFNRWGTYPDPYATNPLNRYAAGWVDQDDVVVWTGGEITLDLAKPGEGGVQAIVIDDGSSYYILGARQRGGWEAFPSVWNGVEAYRVDRCGTCWGLDTVISPVPPVPFSAGDPDSYLIPLPHVAGVGKVFELGDARVTVDATLADGFRVTVGTQFSTRFSDVPTGHTFITEVEWLADEGITLGCNPPANTKFCPDDPVTREQLAAFFGRAFGYTDDGGGDLFDDDNGSTFETDIDRLATAGVTKGCNPPANTEFCPKDKVTREQFAAFMGRAFGYIDDGGGDLFIDDNGSTFETDIDRLATAEVTKGCNPPANTEFCPTNYLTRAQFAAFFYRASN